MHNATVDVMEGAVEAFGGSSHRRQPDVQCLSSRIVAMSQERMIKKWSEVRLNRRNRWADPTRTSPPLTDLLEGIARTLIIIQHRQSA
jgi:hypothetical protein